MSREDHSKEELLNEINRLENRNKALEEKLSSNEKKIKDQMKKFEKIIDGTDIGTWEWNVQTGEAVFNQRWAEIIGYTLEELQPVDIDTWVKYAHPDDLIKSGEALNKHFAQETEFYEFESRMKHKDGHWVWVLDKGQVMEWGEDGKPTWMYGSHLDITERKKAELAKQEQYTLMNLLFTQSLTGIFFMMLDEPVLWNDSVDKEKVLDYVFDHQRITQVNQAMLHQYRAKSEDFIGANPNQLFAHDLEQGRQAWKKLFDEGRLHIDTNEQRFDGSDMAVLGDYICLYDDRGRITGHFGVQIDITDRKKAEEALIESEKRYNLALEGAGAGLWDWDMINNTVYFSPLWKRMLGYEAHELEDTFASWKNCWHPEDADKIEKAMDDYLQGETGKYEITYRLRHKNGEWRWILTRGSIIKDSSGKPSRWIGTNTDITQLIEERKESEELERFFAVNPELMCIADHEANFLKLNNAWSAVTGYSLDEIKQYKYLELVHPDDLKSTVEAMEELSKQQRIINFVNRYRCKDGTYRYLEWRAYPYGNLAYGSARDISDKIEYEKRLRNDLAIKEKLMELINGEHHSVDEFLHGALDLAISFTGSKIGYIFLYDEEKEEFNLHSWSDSVLAECQIKDQKRLYYLGNIGLWGEVIRQRKEIIINDYHAAGVMKKGYPKGHIPVKNFISIPVFHEGKIVAVVGAANKEADYVQEDVVNLNLLANSVWTEVERIKANELLMQEKELFSATVFAIEEGIIVADISGKITLMNPTAEKYTGWTNAEAVGRDFHEVFNNVNIQTRKPARNPVEVVLETGEGFDAPGNLALIAKDGSETYMTGRASKITSAAGEITGVVVAFRNVTKEYLQEKEIEGFLNMNMDMLYVGDLQGNFHKVNKKFEEVLGYSTVDIEGKHFMEFIHPDDLQLTSDALASLSENEPLTGFVNRYRCKDGSYKYIEWNSQPGVGQYIYTSARDVTEKVLKEEELKNKAIRDELTGLYNRHFLETVIDELMDKSDKNNESLAMAILDLDFFKRVNDEFGHPIGDDLLKQTARTIENVVRTSDVVLRLGGEEFVVLMPQTSKDQAAKTCERIRKAIENNNHQVVGIQTVSIGTAERMHYESFGNWYRRADAALYNAKQSGRNRVVTSDEMDDYFTSTMPIFWRAEWESGNEDIDRQHKHMIEIADRLIYMVMEGEDQNEILNQLDKLLNHVVYHFDQEEELLISIGYPENRAHNELHRSLVAKALSAKEAYIKGNIKASALFSFVVDDVIIGHLGKEDLKFFSYLKSV